jgi:hypothetical protein
MCTIRNWRGTSERPSNEKRTWNLEGCGPDSSDSGQRSVAGPCEYGIETSGTTKGGELLDQLSNYQLLNIMTLLYGVSLNSSIHLFLFSLGVWIIKRMKLLNKSRDSSVDIATGYGPDNRMIGVRFPAGAANYFLRHHVQIGSGAYPASYPMDTGGSFPGGWGAVAWSWPLTSI